MKCVLTEHDFESALGSVATAQLSECSEFLDSAEGNKIMDAIPRVIASRFRQMIPDEFRIISVELSIQLEGKVFGCGVSGEATLTFGPV